MKRLKGPDLKMPAIKVPPFLADIYWDLRERRLLPLVVLVVVATAAVPFLLGDDAEQTLPASAEAGAAVTAETESVDSASLTVVEAKPGLRDYRKRLARLKPKDPFRQRFTGPMLEGSELGTETESSSTTTTTTSGESSPESIPSSTPSGEPEIVFFDVAINVKIAKHGGKEAGGKKEKPVVKHRVLPQTPLPGKKAPVVTYMGPAREGNKGTGKVLMIVSDQVRSVFGEAKCLSGVEVCQLLEVEPGFPVTFVYGENEVSYTINVLKVELVVTGREKISPQAKMKSGQDAQMKSVGRMKKP